MGLKTDEPIFRSLVNMDPPDHKPYRQLVMPWFKPSNLNRLEDRLEEITKQILDEMMGDGSIPSTCKPALCTASSIYQFATGYDLTRRLTEIRRRPRRTTRTATVARASLIALGGAASGPPQFPAHITLNMLHIRRDVGPLI